MGEAWQGAGCIAIIVDVDADMDASLKSVAVTDLHFSFPFRSLFSARLFSASSTSFLTHPLIFGPLMNSVMFLITRSRPHTHIRPSSTPTLQSCSFSPAFLYTTPTRTHHRCDYLSLSMYLLAYCALLLPFTHTLLFSLWEQCFSIRCLIAPTRSSDPPSSHAILLFSIFPPPYLLSLLWEKDEIKKMFLLNGNRSCAARSHTLAHGWYGPSPITHIR